MPGGATVARLQFRRLRVRPGQLLYQFLRVDAIDIISIVICVHAMKRQHEAWWRNGSASDSSSEGCVFKSHPGSTILSVFTSRCL